MGKVIGFILGLAAWLLVQLIDFANVILVWAEKAPIAIRSGVGFMWRCK